MLFEKKAETESAAPDDGREMKGMVDCVGYWAVEVVPGRKLKMIAGGQSKLATFTIPLPSGRVTKISAVGPSVLTADGNLWVWVPQHSKWERVGNLHDEAKT